MRRTPAVFDSHRISLSERSEEAPPRINTHNYAIEPKDPTLFSLCQKPLDRSGVLAIDLRGEHEPLAVTHRMLTIGQFRSVKLLAGRF